MRLSVRTLAELVALAAIAFGLWDLHRSSRPPGPSLRALARGAEADRIAALRGLTLLGDEGVAIVPELVLASRDDPEPAVRRGALYALTRVALVEPPPASPVEAALSGADPFARIRGGRSFRMEPPMLRPRANEVFAALVDRMRTDPDPTVRAFAIGCLRKLLTAATRERQMAQGVIKPGVPVPDHPSAGSWVDATLLAVAQAARDPDPEVAGYAVGLITSSDSARVLLTDPRRAELLADLVLDNPAPLATDVELIVLNNLARLRGPFHADTSRLIALLLERLADPRVSGAPEVPRDELARDARRLYGSILWTLVPSAEFLAEHPGATPALLASLATEEARLASGADHRHDWRTNRFTADHLVVDPFGGGRSWGGGRWPFPSAREAALEAVTRDPRLLGFLWLRLARDDRRDWLVNGNGFGRGRGDDLWSVVDPVLDSPDIRADLPPDEANALLARLLDDPDPEPFGYTHKLLVQQVERLRKGRPGSQFATTNEEAANLLVAVRSLAVLCYFARAAEPDSESVSRLVDRLIARLDAPDPVTRGRAATLLGSLGPAASRCLPALEALAEADPDDDPDGLVRPAAVAALERLLGPTSGDPNSSP